MPRPFEQFLPSATKFFGRKLRNSKRKSQHCYLGDAYPGGFPNGLCLHFTAGRIVSRNYSWLAGSSKSDERWSARILQKAREAITSFRNKKQGAILLVDWLGTTMQDHRLSQAGKHGHTANSTHVGVELMGPGKLSRAGSKWYPVWSVKKGVLTKRATPVPEWARRTVKKADYNIKRGTYALLCPAQVGALFQIHYDMLLCDGDNGVYRAEHTLSESKPIAGVTSHELHHYSRSDIGGSLFCNIREFGTLLQAYAAARSKGTDHADAFDRVVAVHSGYAAAYKNWDYDAWPEWG